MATKKETKEALAAAERARLLCGAYKHAWDEIIPTSLSNIGIVSELQCMRCGTLRKDIRNRRGSINYRSYTYNEGYRIGKVSTPEFLVALAAKQPVKLRVVKGKKTA